MANETAYKLQLNINNMKSFFSGDAKKILTKFFLVKYLQTGCGFEADKQLNNSLLATHVHYQANKTLNKDFYPVFLDG